MAYQKPQIEIKDTQNGQAVIIPFTVRPNQKKQSAEDRLPSLKGWEPDTKVASALWKRTFDDGDVAFNGNLELPVEQLLALGFSRLVNQAPAQPKPQAAPAAKANASFDDAIPF